MTDQESTTGQEPEPTPDAQAAPTDEVQNDGDAVDPQIAKLRNEAAKYRTQLRDAQSQIKTLQPMADEYEKLQEAQKTDAERAQERIKALEATIAEKDAQAASMAAQAELLRLSSKAGIDPEVAGLLDLSKIDLTDEESAIATLQKLAPTPVRLSPTSNSGRDAQPDTTQDELRNWYGNRGRAVTAFDQ